MYWKKNLVITFSLFLIFVLTISLIDLNSPYFDNQNNYAIYLEGLTFFSIFCCFMMTLQFKMERILIIGWLFLLIGTFLDVLDEVKSLQIGHVIELVFENGMFTIGMLSISIGFLFIIKKRDELNKKLKHMALYDYLTDLPNRYMFHDYLQKSLNRSKRNNQGIAVMFLDLDRFKLINDTMGHEVGDVLLKQVTKRLLHSVREGDIVARQGGDEFTILLEDVNELQVKTVAERITHLFKEPFILNNEEVFTTASIGICLYPVGGSDSETLIKNADQAMYLTKKSGKNHYKFFMPENEEAIDRKVNLERRLRTALDHNEFVLYYQPQIDFGTGEWKGFEALLRWNHPEFGLVSPTEFIPIAEESGMIIPVGSWVIESVCQQCKAWREKDLSPLNVAINVSALQLEDSHFVGTVKKMLDKYNVNPELLEFEITETVMQNVKKSREILSQLKEIGVKLSIDDFGTGYSSLSVLNQLPIDYVKIDKSFVNSIGVNPRATLLVKTMIEMGGNLNFGLIAEGIENEQQAQFLNQNGCHFGQGYLYSRPIPAEEIESIIKKQVIKAENRQPTIY